MRGSPGVSEAELRPILADVPKIIGDAQAADVLVKRAEELAQKIRDLKMAQARDIFDELRQIESLWLRDPQQALRRLHLLRPKLAYRRKRTPALEPLAQVLDAAIQEVVKGDAEAAKKERFQRLVELAEAIVAYHKYYGGE
ncbi:MAG: type III-A CRISPR-associated protein Csm2 [Candidatus Bipolaricaulota bacterium]|nr:type III-A CRISPR-associated protein Csm2 [Candidatus Bipolaricaulota bacterium]MDW8151808.1 type III-A CRISPR-associated protein Csm2 [Candidatus Bipolaricaulota bacterium]